MSRTNWQVPTVEVDTSDPFATPDGEPEREAPAEGERFSRDPLVTYEGAPDGEKAFAQLRSLIRAEGVSEKTCHPKDRDWSNPTCTACPVRGTRGVLCGIGVAQERALAEFLDSPDVP